MRDLLRALRDDLKSPSGYVLICTLGVVGFAMIVAVRL